MVCSAWHFPPRCPYVKYAQPSADARHFAAQNLRLHSRQCYWRALIRGLTLRQPYFLEAMTKKRRRLIPVRDFLEKRMHTMLQRANSLVDGAGSCLMRCKRAAAGECTRPCME